MGNAKSCIPCVAKPLIQETPQKNKESDEQRQMLATNHNDGKLESYAVATV